MWSRLHLNVSLIFLWHDNGHQLVRQDVRFLTSIVAQSGDTASFDVCLFCGGFIRCFGRMCVGIVSFIRVLST